MTALPLISGSDLPALGWQHVARLLLDVIEPVGNNPMKPTGGLWTSPIRDGRTGWTQWCVREDFATPDAPVTVVVPDPDARVYVIDSHADLLALEAAYRDGAEEFPFGMWAKLNWVAMAADIDAVWLTDDGQWATRMTTPGMYGWDCETVFWLNPRLSVGE